MKTSIIKKIGNIGKFDEIGLSKAIGSSKLSDLPEDSVIAVMCAALINVSDIKGVEPYDTLVLKTTDRYLCTSSIGIIDMFKENDIEDIFNEMPEDKKAVRFILEKKKSKNNTGKFLVMVPVAYE